MSEELQQLLTALDDPQQYVCVPSRIVFDEHDERDESGQVVRSFRKPNLEYIAARSNARDAKGAPTALSIGHMLPGNQPETAQPELVGYARNHRVIYSRELGRWVIANDWYVRRDQYAKAATFPRVSVELHPDDWCIDPISLLRRTPSLDIPQWTYGRSNGRPVLRYSMEDQSVPDPAAPAALPPAAPAAPPAPAEPSSGEKAEAFARHCMSHQYARDFMPAAGAAPALAPPDGSPAAPAGAQTYAAAPAFSSGSNGAPPARAGEPDAYARATAALSTERARADKAERTLKYSRELQKLALDGHAFDLDVELADSIDLGEAQFSRHLERIKRYGKAPVGGSMTRVGEPPQPVGKLTEDMVDVVVKYGEKNRLPYDQALADVLAGKR